MTLPALSVKFARLKQIWSYIAGKVFGEGDTLSTESIPANTPTCCKGEIVAENMEKKLEQLIFFTYATHGIGVPFSSWRNF